MLIFMLGFEFIAIWLIIIYGGAVVMFILIATTLSKTEVSEKFKGSLISFLSVEFISSWVTIFWFVSLDIILNNKAFGDLKYVYDLSNHDHLAVGSGTQELSYYLFTHQGASLLLVGILLFQVMVSSINILFPEQL